MTVDTTRYAPAPGANEQFEEYFRTTWKHVEESGLDRASDPLFASIREYREATGASETGAAREILARAFIKFGTAATWTPDQQVAPDISVVFDAPAQVRELRIPPVTESYWYTDPDQGETIRHFILMRRALGSAFHGGLMIQGGAGYGKTLGMSHLIAQMNADLGLDLRLFRMNCAVQTDPQKWFGSRHINKTRGDWYEKSDFILAVERGDVIQLDEANRIHPHIANSIHSLLDGTQELALPDLNMTIPVNPATVFVATMNIGSQYGGTHRLDQAFRSRFSTTIEVGPPPPEEEIKVVALNTGCPEDAAGKLVEIAVKSRDLFSTGDLRTEISTRDLVAAGRWVAAGKTIRQALELTVVLAFDGDANGGSVGTESDRTKIRRLIEGKIGR